MFRTDDEVALTALYNGKTYSNPNWTVLKIACLDREVGPEPAPYYTRLLSSVDTFIRDRLSQHQEKYADRLRFPDSLIGYLASKTRGNEDC